MRAFFALYKIAGMNLEHTTDYLLKPKWRKEPLTEEESIRLRDPEKWKEESEALLQAYIEKAHSYLGHGISGSPVFGVLLEGLLEITQSEYGFIAQHLYDDDRQAWYLNYIAMTNIAWDEATQKFYDDHRKSGMRFYNLNSLFGSVLTTGKPVISNSPMTDERSCRRLPNGHPPLDSFLGVPLYIGKRVIGSVGMANRPFGYTQDIVDFLKPFLLTSASVMRTVEMDKVTFQLESEVKQRVELEKSLLEKNAQMTWLIETCERIRETPDFSIILNKTSSEIGSYFDSPTCVALHHKDTNEWEYKYSHGEEFRVDPTFKFDSHESYWSSTDCITPKSDSHVTNLFFRIDINSHPTYSEGVVIVRMNTSRVAEAELRVKALLKHVEMALVQTLLIKEASDLNLKREAAEAISNAKSQFLATVSHEIRTPMHALIGHADLLQQSGLTPEQQEMLSYIRSSSSLLLDCINDILEFSKCESDKIVLDPKPFSVNEIIELAFDLVYHAANEKFLHLNYITESNVPFQLIADDLRIRQVLINFLSNAIKFTHVGEIFVTARMSGTPDHPQLSIDVSDSGIGIAADKIDSLFTRFSQADSSTTRRFGGTGLGLSICKHLVTKLGGKIDVKSSLGEGTVFTFSVDVKTMPSVRPISGPLLTRTAKRLKTGSHPPSPVNASNLVQTALKDVKRCFIYSLGAGETRSLVSKIESCGMTVHQSTVLRDLMALQELNFLISSKNRDVVVLVAVDNPSKTFSDTEVVAWFENTARQGVNTILLTWTAPDDTIWKPYFKYVLLRPLRLSLLKRTIQVAFDGWRYSPVPAALSSSPETVRMRVLLVEDNRINQKVTRRMLESIGHTCFICENGQEAVDHVLQNYSDYDLILMDLHMPVMDGIEAADRLKRTLGVQCPTIMAMTASVASHDIANCKRVNMHPTILSKPCTFEHLRQTLKQVFAEKHGTGKSSPNK